MPITFDNPTALWWLLLAAPIIGLGMRSLGGLQRHRRVVAIAMRLLVLAALVGLLAGVQSVREHDDLVVVAVVDDSQSVRRFADGSERGGDREKRPTDLWRGTLATSLQPPRASDRVGVIGFDGRATVWSAPGTPAADTAVRGTAVQVAAVEGTAPAVAIRQGMALFAPDAGRRLVLAWDGNATQPMQEVLRAAHEAAAAGVPIDVLPITYRVDGEVMVDSMHAPAQASTGQTVPLRVVLAAAAPSRGRLFILHDGVPVNLNGEAPGMWTAIGLADWTRASGEQASGADAATYLCVRLIEVPLSERGPHRFEAVFEDDAGDVSGPRDQVAANNRASTFTFVHGQGRVLVLDGVGGEAAAILPAALRQHDIDVEVLLPSGAPLGLESLARYDAVLLQNVPAEALSPGQQRNLAQYVADLGGGMAMIGGPHSFGAGGWANTPVDAVLPVHCEIPSQMVLPSGALVLVLDRSGSMSELVSGLNHSKVEVASEAAVLAMQTLFAGDLLGVVAFDHTPKWVVPLGRHDNPRETARRIRSIESGGGTDILPALEVAVQALAPLGPRDAAIKHIILLTDGYGQDVGYEDVLRRMVEADITLSTVGIGDARNSPLLAELAEAGGGAYHPVNDPRRLPQVFIKEARTIRRNLIKEVPFVPVARPTFSPVTAGMGATPQLAGLVVTAPRSDPRVVMPWMTPDGEPLLAHWQVGLGRVAAFTSDAHNRWASAWLGWSGYGDFWARLTRYVARPAANRSLDLVSVIEDDRLHLRLDVAVAGAAGMSTQATTAWVAGTVVGPDGTARGVELTQTAAGLYEANLPAMEDGAYLVTLAVDDGRSRQMVFGGAAQPPGRELRDFASRRGPLEQVARITGGRVLEPASLTSDLLFDRTGIEPIRSLRPLLPLLLPWLIALLLVDVANRRVAWSATEAAAWASGRWRALTRHLSPRRADAAAATLGHLRRRAAEVDARMERLQQTQSQASEATQRPSVVGSKAASGPQDGRQTQPPEGVEPDKPAAGGLGEGRSRLLEAKRRARRRFDENR